MSLIIDETICPFCKSKNQCMAHIEKPCWCNNANIHKELIKLAPEKTKGKACICLDCINSFKKNPKQFIKNLKA